MIKTAHIFFANMECNTLAEFSSSTTANGTISASIDHAKTGTYSLKSDITIVAGNAYVYNNISDSIAAEIYSRFYFYLPTATYNTLDIDLDMFRLYRLINAGWGEIMALFIRNNAGTVNLWFDYGPASDSCTCPTRDTWHCIETYHKRDAANGAWEWWIDGVSEGSGSGINTGATNARYATFGASVSGGMTGAFYLDNIVLATTRIYELMGNIPQGNALRKRVESPQGWII